MLTTAGKNAAANALSLAKASLHSANPGTNGANELSGGTYARKDVSYGAAANGVRSLSASVLIDVPAGATVAFVGIWDTAGTTLVDVLTLATPETYSNAGQYELKTHTVTIS